MKANVMTGKIEISAAEAAKIGTIGSKAYNEYMILRNAFPGYELEVIKKVKNKSAQYRGLTIDKMEAYIKKHIIAPDDNRLNTFYKLQGLDENKKEIAFAKVSTYGQIKLWFLENFPEIEEFGKDVDDIIKAAHDSRNARKAA